MSDGTIFFRKMNYYMDRGKIVGFIDIADQCVENILPLWDIHCFDINGYQGNIFQHEFDGMDLFVKKEYLFAMDYLSCVLTAYKETGNEVYKDTFEKIIDQFHEYLNTDEPFYADLPIFAQTLLFIKAIDILGSIPYQKDFLELLRKYAEWFMDDNNYAFGYNHGLFSDLGLLHISVLLEGQPDFILWREYAISRINNLYEVAYYNDFTNNENSIKYFDLNNKLYEQIIKFCKYYDIDGIKKIEDGLEMAKEALTIFAHKDHTFPLIGDGRVFNSKTSNDQSRLFPDIGIAIVKVGEVYMSFKCKTVDQVHAHMDVSSITARYKNIDFLIDSGQYNHDRYTPANRFMRSTAGHSGIFPVFADGMFQKEFCDSLGRSEITVYEYREDNAFVKGEYQLDGVHVCREISVLPNEIKIKDSWRCEEPTAMRQRFIIPKELIDNCRFTASQRILESHVENVKFKFEITSDVLNPLTTIQFGVAAPQFYAYEKTMLLDTFAENTVYGEITTKISFEED